MEHSNEKEFSKKDDEIIDQPTRGCKSIKVHL